MIKKSNLNHLIKGVMAGCLFAIISLFIFSLIMYFFDFPIKVESGGLYILLNLSLFISSFYIGKKVSKKGYLYGIFSAGIFILLLLIVNIIFNYNNFNLLSFLLSTPYIIILCMISGIIGANRK